MPAAVIHLKQEEDFRDVVHQTVQVLAEGGVVAFPTETVYGLAASALRADAVEHLLQAKDRPQGHALALAIKGYEEAWDYVPDLSPVAQRLARRCWPGPVTLVVDDRHPESLLNHLPESVFRAVVPEKTVGLRVPAHQLILEVMQLLAGPLVLTSANLHGQPDAVTGQDVLRSVGDRIHLVLDDGPCRYGRPSTVVRVFNSPPEVKLLREGVVSAGTVRRLASIIVVFVCTGNTCRSPMAEHLFRHLLARRLDCSPEELEDRGVLVFSAGVAAAAGAPASPEAVETLRQRGIALQGHESQPLSEQLARHADFLLTMTQAHRHALVEHWPEVAPRTFLLCGQEDVADPIGGPLEAYQRCADQIQRCLEPWVEKVAQEAQSLRLPEPSPPPE